MAGPLGEMFDHGARCRPYASASMLITTTGCDALNTTVSAVLACSDHG
jgi:hypothetical protein